MLLGMHTFTYPERLKLLGLNFEETRKEKNQCWHTVYKFLFGLISPPSRRLFYSLLCESICTRGHLYQLFLQRCSTDVRCVRG